jgi:hypothetical protein
MDQFGDRAGSPLGRAEDLLVDSEEAGEHGAVLLVQLPGTAAADVLLDVGRVASEKAGNRGVITPSLLDQIVQGFACIFHRCGSYRIRLGNSILDSRKPS